MNTLIKMVATTCVLCLIAPAASAQDDVLTEAPAPTSGVELSGDVLAIKTVTDETGAERTERVKPDLIVPGDRLIFGTDYANNGDQPVTNFVVTNPLPAAVRLAPDADADLMVSIDGATTWGVLSSLTVTAEDGSIRPATHADVTHVRWTLASIAPGESGRLEYPAIIR